MDLTKHSDSKALYGNYFFINFKAIFFKMSKNPLLFWILCVFFIIDVNSYTSVNPTWVTNNYFRAGNSKVINSNTNGGTTRTKTLWFTSFMTGTPAIAYGIKSFKGIFKIT